MTSSYKKPLLAIVNCHPNGGYTFYNVTLIYSDVDVTFVQRKFMTLLDVVNWLAIEYYDVPHVMISLPN